MRIVVIDRDAAVRALVRVYLDAAGFEVFCAQDAIGGGHLVLEMLPSLVLCEVKLPYMNGYEFAADLRVDPLTRGIPLVLMSLRGEMPYDAGRLGVVACIKKPINRDRLLDVINALKLGQAGNSWAVLEPGRLRPRATR